MTHHAWPRETNVILNACLELKTQRSFLSLHVASKALLQMHCRQIFFTPHVQNKSSTFSQNATIKTNAAYKRPTTTLPKLKRTTKNKYNYKRHQSKKRRSVDGQDEKLPDKNAKETEHKERKHDAVLMFTPASFTAQHNCRRTLRQTINQQQLQG